MIIRVKFCFVISSKVIVLDYLIQATTEQVSMSLWVRISGRAKSVNRFIH